MQHLHDGRLPDVVGRLRLFVGPCVLQCLIGGILCRILPCTRAPGNPNPIKN